MSFESISVLRRWFLGVVVGGNNNSNIIMTVLSGFLFLRTSARERVNLKGMYLFTVYGQDRTTQK